MNETASLLWSHDAGLVTIAIAVCLLGSWTVFLLADRSVGTGERGHGIWMVAAGTAAGCSIWATHFIAMMALDHAMPMRYEVGGTISSIGVAVAMSTLALNVALGLGREGGRMAWRTLGGILIGAGITSMHFIGMAATTMAEYHDYSQVGVVLAVVAGMLLSIGAMTAYRASDATRRMASAGLLGLAVIVIHFGSMASMRMTKTMNQHEVAAIGSHAIFALALAGVVGLLLLLAFVGATVADRMDERDRAAAERLRSLADMSLEGILVVSAGGVIIDANDRMRGFIDCDPVGMALATQLPEVCEAIRGSRAEQAPIETVLARREAPDMHVQAFVHQSRHADQPAWTVVVRDLTATREAEARIRHAANHDPLTDLPNRSLMMDRLARALARTTRTGEPCAMLYIDLDGFKVVNDTMGHGRGDEVLRDVAKLLLSCVRDGDTVARIGGDEFVIVQEDQSPQGAAATAAALIRAVGHKHGRRHGDVSIGMSIGIAMAPNDATDAGEIIRFADVALYRAKADGKNQARFFERSMDQEAREQRQLEVDLGYAIGRGELSVAYQPQMDVETGAITGFEALARWTHPRRGEVPPAIFIPVAERTGLIGDVGAWIMRTACLEAASWTVPLRIAVNLSSLQIRDEGLVDAIERILAETELAADRLEIEVTETAVLHDGHTTLAAMERMKALGIKIAMDDFGTGYSSLSSLHSFPFDTIKIDKSFVSAIEQDGKAASIVRAVIGLCHSLGLRIVAEGVENQNQLELLRAERCTEIQGFLVGRPLAVGAWTKIVDGERRNVAA